MMGLCIAVFMPLTMLGRTAKSSLPDGACGSPQTMLEATETGQAMVQEVFSRGMRWSDNSLNEYVNRLGQNLARSSGSQQVFSFYVLYNPKVNAQSFPGGYVVINSGVISLAANEAELASVLSHEIAHENSCDWRAGPSKGNLFELLRSYRRWCWEGRRESSWLQEPGGRQRRPGHVPAGARKTGLITWQLNTWFAPATTRALLSNSSSGSRLSKNAPGVNLAGCWPRIRAPSIGKS